MAGDSGCDAMQPHRAGARSMALLQFPALQLFVECSAVTHLEAQHAGSAAAWRRCVADRSRNDSSPARWRDRTDEFVAVSCDRPRAIRMPAAAVAPNVGTPDFYVAAQCRCNDPPLPAQVRPLTHTPQRVFSSSAPDGVADGCRSGSSRRSCASHGSGFRSDAGARTAPSGCG